MASTDAELTAPASSTSLSSLATTWALPLALAGYLAVASLFSVFAIINRDEGWYLLGGRSVYDGKVLYRDFPFFQGPVSAYIYGLPQWIAGSSFTAGRVTALALACATAGLAAWLASTLSGRVAAAVAVAILAITPSFVVTATTARSEAIVTPLVLLAALLLVRVRAGFWGIVGAPLVLIIASATRLTYLPPAAVVLAFTLWRAHATPRQMALAIACCAGALAVLFGPYLVADADATIFNVWRSQTSRDRQFLQDGPSYFSEFPTRMRWIMSAMPIFLLTTVPGPCVVAYLAGLYHARWRPDIALGDAGSRTLALVALATLVWVPSFALSTHEARYFAPSFAVLAVVVADLTVRAWRGELGDAGALFRYLLPVLAAPAIFIGMADSTLYLDTRHPPVGETNEAAAYIRSVVPEDGTLVTLDGTLVVASERDTPDELVMGFFSYWPYMDQERTHRLHLVNKLQLEALMLDPSTDAVALDEFDLGWLGGVRADDDRPAPFQVFPRLEAQFEVGRQFPAFGQVSTTLWVLIRRK
jgi:4-amino-4-deoxy-L-arabinose transferase-like glycosyltransferase